MEIHEVSLRPIVVTKLKITADRVSQFLEAIEAVGTILEGFPEPFEYARDPDDAHYVNLAIAADARLIVSRDKDLLDLMDASKPEASEFQRRFPALQILTPVGFLQVISV